MSVSPQTPLSYARVVFNSSDYYYPHVYQSGFTSILFDAPRIEGDAESGYQSGLIDGTWTVNVKFTDLHGNLLEEWETEFDMQVTLDAKDVESANSSMTVTTAPHQIEQKASQ